MEFKDFVAMFNMMVMYYFVMVAVSFLGMETYPWLKKKYISWKEKKSVKD